MKNRSHKIKKYLALSSGSLIMMFGMLCRRSGKALAMEEAEGSAYLNEEASAGILGQESLFILTDGAGCFVHWIMIALTVLFFMYQAVRFLKGKNKKVRVREFVPAGFYVVLMLVALAFGDCYIDFIVMVSGVALAAAGVWVTLVQYKKSVNAGFHGRIS